MSAQTVLDFTIPHGMEPALADVWHAIRFREGEDQAIKCEELAARVKMSTRNVQKCVRKLINDWGKPIGTSHSSPFGYYHAVTPAERAKVAAKHRKRAKKILATAAALEGVSKAEYIERYQTELVA